MTLAIYTRPTEGIQDSARAALEETFLVPAVDTPLKESLSSTARALSFSPICRTFRSGGTRIRTGDTMIFSHIQKPLGMRQILIGKRIYVHGVPSDTSWFCPYCCASCVGTCFLCFTCKSVYSKSGAEGIRTPNLRRAKAYRSILCIERATWGRRLPKLLALTPRIPAVTASFSGRRQHYGRFVRRSTTQTLIPGFQVRHGRPFDL
jgi:hypothetical protein